MAKRKTPRPPNAVNYHLIPETDPATGHQHDLYALRDRLIATSHPHLAEARVALAWRWGWTPNRDGRLTLGQCRKASGLDRELHQYDIVILLNGEAWADLSGQQREAVLDHELCHAAVDEDEGGEPRRDTRGRVVYRVRGHDLYRADLESFAAVCARARQEPLFRVVPEGEVC
jgi:hypothetical protein